MKIKYIVFIGIISSIQFSNARTTGKMFALGFNLTKTEYNGDYGNAIWNFNVTDYLCGGLSFVVNLNPSFDLSLQGNYGSYGYDVIYDSQRNFLAYKLDLSTLLHYKLNNGYLLNEDIKISPFLSLGIGYASYSRDNRFDTGTPPRVNVGRPDFIIPFGGGLQYMISNNFALKYQYLYYLTNNDKHDNNIIKPGNDAFGQHLFSVMYLFSETHRGESRQKDHCQCDS